MLRYGDLQLAGTMFHELAHQLIYVKGDSEFNEAFAMSVERAGVARWLEFHGRRMNWPYRERMQQQAAVHHILAAGRAQLAALYARRCPPDERRRASSEHDRDRGRVARL